MSKLKRKKKKTVSGTSLIKWERTEEPGGNWINDFPVRRYELNPTSRYKCAIYRQMIPKSNPSMGYNWTLRDRVYSINCVAPHLGNAHTSLKECKRRVMLAFIFWVAVRLIRETDNPREIDNSREFLNV